MAKKKESSVQFHVCDIVVPTFQEGNVVRACTVAYRRVGPRTLEGGLAVCNALRDTFSASNGQTVALGRLVRRPILVTSEARTPEGLSAALARAATIQNLWRATRRDQA